MNEGREKKEAKQRNWRASREDKKKREENNWFIDFIVVSLCLLFFRGVRARGTFENESQVSHLLRRLRKRKELLFRAVGLPTRSLSSEFCSLRQPVNPKKGPALPNKYVRDVSMDPRKGENDQFWHNSTRLPRFRGGLWPKNKWANTWPVERCSLRRLRFSPSFSVHRVHLPESH